MSLEPEEYQSWFRADVVELVEGLRLTEIQKHALRSRWLDRVIWTERQATRSRRFYYVLRLTAILGGVLVPALVSLNLANKGAVYLRWVTFVISLAVAGAIALEEFFHFGDRWRHFRRTAEWLKIEGWQFLQLTGLYHKRTHAEAYAVFARRIERVIHDDVDAFVSQIVFDKRDPGLQHGTEAQDVETPSPESPQAGTAPAG